MNTIIEKYFLNEGSELVYFQEGSRGVDCWFDVGNFRQHRCLSFEDFALINAK